jgi:O-antigen/teichoic acid export membrane protein
MKNDIHSTLKHTIIYSLGNLSIKAVGFILLPLYTSYLSVSNFGILGIFDAIMQFSVAVFSYKLSTAMMRWLVIEKEIKKQKQIIFTAFSTTIILLIPVILVLIFTKNYLAVLFFDSELYSNYLLILIYTIVSEILLSFILDIIRTREKSILYLIFTVSKVFLNLVLTIYFVTKLKMGVEGVILSQLLASVFILIISTPILLKNILLKFNIQIAKEMLYYGIPLVFSTISTMILTLSDRFYLKFYYNLSEVGIFNLSYKIASVINIIIIQSFQLGFLPIAFKKYEEGNTQVFFIKVLKYYSTILMIFVVILSIFSKEIILLLAENKEYFESYYFVPIIAFTFYIKGIQYNYSLGLHFVKKTKYNVYVVLTGVIINLILNFLFVPKFGIWGATISSVIAGIVILIMFYKLSQREYKIDYNIRELLLLSFLGVIFIVLGYYLSSFSFLIGVILKLLSIFLFVFLLYFLKYFNEDELNVIKSIRKKFLKF